MTVKEMFNELEDKERDTIIVTLKYKYDFEENYTIENHILEYDSMSDSYVWLNDWNEGQTDVEVLGYMPLGNVDTTKIEPCEDCISRQAVNVLVDELARAISDERCFISRGRDTATIMQDILDLPSVTPKARWIPVSEKLPKDLEPVNITWINHNPESYYADIKDKPFTATGVYFNGQWYWWSKLCTDTLAEYSHNYDDIIDDDIEIIAWQPLPEPYKAESEDK